MSTPWFPSIRPTDCSNAPCRTFQHSLDVRGVALNSKVILTADENSDIFVWDAHLATKREVYYLYIYRYLYFYLYTYI